MTVHQCSWYQSASVHSTANDHYCSHALVEWKMPSIKYPVSHVS